MLTLFERLTFEQLPFYLHFMKHLAARGMPVPDPVANANGAILHSLKERPAVVVNRLPGESETAPTASHCSSVGEILARMHLAGSDYPRQQANPRGLEWWNEVVPVVGRCVSDGQRSLLSSELVFQNQIALSSTYEQLPRGPVHADLFRDNVLFDGGHLTGVFDFYFAGCDAFLFDIAVCLNDWCVDDSHRRANTISELPHSWAPMSAFARSLQPNTHCFLRCSALEHFVFGYRVSGICTSPGKLRSSKHTIPATSSASCECFVEKSHEHDREDHQWKWEHHGADSRKTTFASCFRRSRRRACTSPSA